MADDRVKFRLAVSLHSAIQPIREKIMPFSVKFPLEELAKSLKYWYQKTSKSVTYEYIIWKDINDNEKLIQIKSENGKKFPKYPQVFEYKFGFIENLSVLDLIFNLGPESNNYLNSI